MTTWGFSRASLRAVVETYSQKDGSALTAPVDWSFWTDARTAKSTMVTTRTRAKFVDERIRFHRAGDLPDERSMSALELLLVLVLVLFLLWVLPSLVLCAAASESGGPAPAPPPRAGG